MTRLSACPSCGGRPLHGWGVQKSKDPALVGGVVRFVDGGIPRRRCTACGLTHLDPAADPVREARIGEARRFMVGCYAREGAEAAAALCGVQPKTLAAYVEEELERMLATPVSGPVFFGAVPRSDGAVVLGEVGSGQVLDALAAGADPLGETLERRGGEVGFAWIPMAAGIRDAARDVIPDATLALCTVEVARFLDWVLDALPPRFAGEAHVLRHVSERRWTVDAYEGLKALARKAGLAKPCIGLRLWDEEILNALAAAGQSPGVRVPDPLHGLRPLRLRGLAAVTPLPTLAAMSEQLVLRRTLQRQP